MAHIRYTATYQTMGGADVAYADRYAAALKKELEVRFPGIEVSVELDHRVNESFMDVSDNIDADEVRCVANEVWNGASF